MTSSPYSFLQHQQSARNAQTATAWDHFASHRTQITNQLRGIVGRCVGRHALRMCVLGAGNCNDLDLLELCQLFAQLTLVDIDRSALQAAVARVGLEASDQIEIRAPLDLTGLSPEFAHWSECLPTPGVVKSALERLRGTSQLEVLSGGFDVVLSSCVLTQLIDSAQRAIGEDHEEFFDLLSALRLRHIEHMLELLRGDGVGLLVTDLVSTDTWPGMRELPIEQLPQAAAAAVRDKNFFSGVNPSVIYHLLKNHPTLSAKISQVTPISPWIWDWGTRAYVVYGMQFRRSAHG
ncbi:hypothetical protein [Aureliella helgolandensis]|uniref:Leucine carboxyl methyltransferase n=1 Tax=Aureliella helgolandensis TaxID=2527968 RepID=A0A518G7W1_9BACT|nr:hypothetical protein [Aureliella helgolandensis]QDV24686.1 hypothetical protein Q31a_30070 [Aureliella helgolandensis]